MKVISIINQKRWYRKDNDCH